MQAGDLHVRLMADIAQFQRQMAQANTLVGQSARQMEASFVGMGSRVAGALAAAFSVASILAWTRQAIDAADQAGKLAQTIGVATEQVAGLQLAFRQSGLQAEQLAPIMSKLAAATANGNKALEAMNVATRNADGSLRSTRQVLGDVADRFAGYADGASKTALAVALLGEEGAKLVPLLNGGAAGLADMDAKAKALGLTLDADAARAAARFNDEMDLLRARAQGAVQSIGIGLLPVLNELLAGFTSATDATERYKGVVEALRIPIEALSISAANVWFVLESMGREIGAIAAQMVALGRMDIDGFNAISEAVKEDGRRARAELDDFERRVLQSGRRMSTAVASSVAPAIGGAQAPVIGGATDNLGTFITTQLAAQRQRELDAMVKAQADATKAMIEEMDRQAKAADALARAEEQYIARGRKAREDAAKASADATVQRLAEMQDEERAIAIAAQQNVTLAEAIEMVAIARLYEQSVGLDAADPRAAAIDREIQAREKLLQLMRDRGVRDANKQAADQAARDWAQVTQQIGQSLTDALMSGSMKAGDFIKNLFKTMVLRPVIQAVMNPVMGAIGSGLGMAGNAAASTGGGGGGTGGLSLVSTALQMAGAYGGLAGAGAAMTLAGNTGMALSAASAAMSAGSVGAGLSIGIGAIAPYALAAIAVVALLKRRLKDAGIEGTFGPGGFSGNQFKDWSGNLFLSAKTSRTPLDNELQTSLSRTFVGIRDGVRDMAATLNIGADAIDNFTKDVRISTKGLNEQQVQEALQKQFDAIGEELAALALGTTATIRETVERTREVLTGYGEGDTSYTETYLEEVDRVIAGTGAAFLREGETAAQALQRLSTALTSVNPMLDVLGQQMFDLGIAGADLASQLADLFGGPEGFTQVAGQYYQAFYTEAERTATTTRLLTTELAGLGLTLPPTREAFRAIVEAQDLTTESGRSTYAALLQMSGAFASITQSAEDLTNAAAQAAAEVAAQNARIAQERAGLNRQLMELRGDTAVIRAEERAALDQSNRALFDRINLLQDARAAEEQAALASQQAAEALRNQISSLQSDLAAAQAERLQIAQRVVSERDALEQRLLQLQGDTVALREREIAALDPLNQAFARFVFAAEDAKTATDALAQRMTALADAGSSIATFIAELRAGTATGSNLSALRAAYQSTLSRAQGGDVTASGEVVGAARAMLDAAQSRARTRAEADLMAARVAAELEALPATKSFQERQAKALEDLVAYSTTVDKLAQQSIDANVESTLRENEAQVASLRSLVSETIVNSSKLTTLNGTIQSLTTSIGQLTTVSQTQASATQTQIASQINSFNTQGSAQTQSLVKLQKQYQDIYDKALDEFFDSVWFSTSAQKLTEQEKLLTGGQWNTVGLASSAKLGNVDKQVALDVLSNYLLYPTLFDSSGKIYRSTTPIKFDFPTYEEILAGTLLNQSSGPLGMTTQADGINDAQALEALLGNISTVQSAVNDLREAITALGGTPTFATGGLHSGGLRLVGEQGPELEVTGPARYWSASDTMSMLGNAGRRDEVLVAEIRALRAEVTNLRAEARATAENTGKQRRMWERVTRDGESLLVTDVTPAP